jgi:hypothetical protein
VSDDDLFAPPTNNYGDEDDDSPFSRGTGLFSTRTRGLFDEDDDENEVIMLLMQTIHDFKVSMNNIFKINYKDKTKKHYLNCINYYLLKNLCMLNYKVEYTLVNQ